MTLVSLSKPCQLPELERAIECIEKGDLEKGRKLFESIKPQTNEALRVRAAPLMDLLSRHQGTSDWERRSKEMSAIFRQYAAISSPTPLQTLTIASTSLLHYPVLFIMQKLIVNDLADNEKNLPFLNEKFLPALHIYLKTGCLEELRAALQILQDNKYHLADLFLSIIRDNPKDLRKPIGSFLPEKDFPGCFDESMQQKSFVAETIPYWKQIYLLLEQARQNKTKAEDAQLGPVDKKQQEAKLEKIFSKVSSEFRELFERAYCRAEDRAMASVDYINVVKKFDMPANTTTFGEYASQIDFSLEIFERIKRDLVFLRDFNFLRLTCNMSRLEAEWNEFSENEPTARFSTFITNKVCSITQKWEAKKWSALRGQWAVLTVEDPAYYRFYKSIQFMLKVAAYEVQMFTALYTLPIETGRLMGIKDDMDGTVQKGKTGEKRESKSHSPPKTPSPASLPKFTKVRVSPLTISPSRESPVPMMSRASPTVSQSSPRASPITVPMGIPEILQTVLAPLMAPFRNKAAHRSFKNGLQHIENMTVLLDRLKASSKNIFSNFALLGASLATAIENLQKAYLHEEGISFHKSSHNLLRLSANIPFIPVRHITYLRSVNFAERDIRYSEEAEDIPSAFQRELRQVRSSPQLLDHVERIKTLFQRTFPVLCTLVNRGKAKEVNFEDAINETLRTLQEPSTYAQMPSRHQEIIPILERVSKLISSISINDKNRLKLKNLMDNLLFRLREEASLNPSAHGMRLHYGTLFRFLPL